MALTESTDTGTLTFLVPGDPEQLTGGYVYNRRIVGALRAAGHRVQLLGLDGRFPDPDPEARRSADRTLATLPESSLVIVDGLALGGLPEVIRRHREGLQILALVHHPLADETGLAPAQAQRLRLLETEALANVRGVITTSDYTARRLADFGVGPNRLAVVEPGTDPAPVAVGSGAVPSLLCVASLIPRKGQDLLLQALSGLTHMPWHCDMVGSRERDPAFAATLDSLRADLGLAQRVSLRGELAPEQLAALYHRADLFVLPSHYEGYGMVITEALARGLPVITTTGGALQFTLPDLAGIKVPPGNGHALRDALAQLLSNPGERLRLRKGASRARSGLTDWTRAGGLFAAALQRLATGACAHG